MYRAQVGPGMNVEVADGLFSRLRGLLGRPSFEGALLLVPCNDVHTFGMRRELDIAFLDSRGVVLGVYREVRPGCRLRFAEAAAVLERYASPGEWLETGDNAFAARPMRKV